MLEPSDPTYGFPFTPYEQQQQLMDHLYRAMAAGEVTVIESPTGTVRGLSQGRPELQLTPHWSPPLQGKSLSLISSSLSFLRDAKAHERHNLVASIRAAVADNESFKDEPQWVVEHEIKTKLAELDRQEKELEERLEKIRERERLERAKAAAENGKTLARKRQVR